MQIILFIFYGKRKISHRFGVQGSGFTVHSYSLSGEELCVVTQGREDTFDEGVAGKPGVRQKRREEGGGRRRKGEGGRRGRRKVCGLFPPCLTASLNCTDRQTDRQTNLRDPVQQNQYSSKKSDF